MSFIIYLHVLLKKKNEIVTYYLSASQNQTYITFKYYLTLKKPVFLEGFQYFVV